MNENNRVSLGRYEILKTLGRGSQGRVYLARDPQLERDVAVKVITSDKAEFTLKGANGTPLEALIAGRVSHANIIPIYDIGESELGPYLVFGYVEGRTLAMALGFRKQFEVADAVSIMRQILDAMAAAHAAGVLHLDLGPRNIMLDEDGIPRIMDFGLSQFVDFKREDMELATGTLRYMAPEHFLRQQLGPFTDVFALASTFYEMLVGHRAIDGTDMREMQRAIAEANIDLTPLDKLPHGDEFKRFFRGAFTVETDKRYADAGVMLKAFDLLVTAAGLADNVRDNDPSHSTVDFLVRRMQRKKDFPAISSTLTEINRLTGDDAEAPADKLANVILRDMSLTSKLLKMANSSFYGSRMTEVTKISQAVVLLGVQQIRMVSSSLILFGNLKSDSRVLRDSMTKSFFAGLISRHLARREKLRNAEEVFIAGMCQNLGENLTIYYFPEEHEDIEALRRKDERTRHSACREVLGITYAELGARVAEMWALPQIIVDTIAGAPDPQAAPSTNEEKGRNLAILGNALCNAFVGNDVADIAPMLTTICKQFAHTTLLGDDYLVKLFGAAIDKLQQFAPVFEINTADSEFCNAVNGWITYREAELGLDTTTAETTPQTAQIG